MKIRKRGLLSIIMLVIDAVAIHFETTLYTSLSPDRLAHVYSMFVSALLIATVVEIILWITDFIRK